MGKQKKRARRAKEKAKAARVRRNNAPQGVRGVSPRRPTIWIPVDPEEHDAEQAEIRIRGIRDTISRLESAVTAGAENLLEIYREMLADFVEQAEEAHAEREARSGYPWDDEQSELEYLERRDRDGTRG